MIVSLIALVQNTSAALLVFHSGSAFEAHLSDGIGIALLCSVVGPALLLCLSRLPAVLCADAFMAALCAAMADEMLARDPETRLGTVAAAMAVCTTLLGLCYLALSLTRVGVVVHFVPSPVLQGCLASPSHPRLSDLTSLH